MAKRMGVREFRDNFTTIAREAKETVIVTNHDKVVGWFTPSARPLPSTDDIFAELREIRRQVEARGVDIAGIMKELGVEDDKPFDEQEAAQVSERKTKWRRELGLLNDE